jgi:hypothetical protein
MNTVKASCGHYVIAEGAPGSSARKAQEKRTCGKARCESRLPDKFTDRECEAYVFMLRKRDVWIRLDKKTKSVVLYGGPIPMRFDNLVELAEFHGWRG